MDNPLKYFAELRDPRVERNREHLLEEILLIAIAAVLSGAESWNDIAEYGEDKQEWLKRRKQTRDEMSTFKKRLQEREALSAEERPNMQRTRLNGGEGRRDCRRRWRTAFYVPLGK